MPKYAKPTRHKRPHHILKKNAKRPAYTRRCNIKGCSSEFSNCGRQAEYLTKRNLSFHMAKFHNIYADGLFYYTCNKCTVIWISQYELERHQKTCTGVKKPPIVRPFQCPLCKKFYKSDKSLSSHQNQIHGIYRRGPSKKRKEYLKKREESSSEEEEESSRQEEEESSSSESEEESSSESEEESSSESEEESPSESEEAFSEKDEVDQEEIVARFLASHRASSHSLVVQGDNHNKEATKKSVE
eukprot:g7484.t1